MCPSRCPPKKASSRPKRSAVEGPPHLPLLVLLHATQKTVISTLSAVERADARAAAVEKSASLPPPLCTRSLVVHISHAGQNTTLIGKAGNNPRHRIIPVNLIFEIDKARILDRDQR